MDKKRQTVDSYNRNAFAFARKFNNIKGARVKHIAETFSHVHKKNPHVLDIGCANGRDAKEILKYTSNYLGIDISKKLIEIAKKSVPEAKFEVADVEEYNFPPDVDIIFAFASLLHSNRNNLKKVIDKAYLSLNKDGVFYLSLKCGTYHEQTVDNEYGIRTYYFYSLGDIKKIINGKFRDLKEEVIKFKGGDWLEMIIQKI